MKYIKNPHAVGWRVTFFNAYSKGKNRMAFILHKVLNKLRLNGLNSKFNRVLLLVIATTLLFTTLFSISFIIIVGLVIFVFNHFWQTILHLFMPPIKQKP